MKKTIALFGGTGRTGQHVVKQGLAKGYKIKTLARNPDKLTIANQNLEIIQGDVHDAPVVEKVVEGSDVVINVVGHTKNSAKDVQTVATENIIKAMKKHGISRIISLSGAGLDSPKDINHFGRKMVKFAMKLLAKDILKDAESHYE
ncbi:MAG: NAD(P)-dependent oxidoreductase, partial [Prolixibacteraceae bacterium]